MSDSGTDHNAGWWRGAARAVRLACPRCGRARVFRRFFWMNDACAQCGLIFDRGDGYWLGAMAFNMALSIGGVVAILVAAVWLTSPDPNWNAVIALLVIASVALPIVLFPFTRTLWVAAERAARLRGGIEAD